MKSKPEETAKHLTTSCKDCVFAQYDRDTQTGCEAGRVDMFKDQGCVVEAYDEEKEFYVIDRFCNYYRTSKWDGYCDGKADVQLATDEVKPRVFIAVYFDTPTIDQVSTTLDSILSLEGDKDHIFVGISQGLAGTSKKERHLSTHLFTMLENHDIKCKVMINFAEQMREYDLFRAAGGSSHITTIKAGDTMPADLLVRLDDELNQKYKRVVFFDYQGISVIMYSVYLSRYGDFFNYTKFQRAIKKEAQEANMYMELL